MVTTELTPEQEREVLLMRALDDAVPGEVLVMPWGERVEMRPRGERHHSFELTETEMRNLRAALAGDGGVANRAMRWLLRREER